MRYVYNHGLLVSLGLLVIGLSVSSSYGQVAWTAYNDCVDDLLPNTTGWTIYDGYTSNTTGPLINYETGSDEGMPTVTFTMDMDNQVERKSGQVVEFTTPGTDGYDIFEGKADISGDNIQYGPNVGWWVDMEFTGLDTNKTYTYVGTTSRNKLYTNRKTLVTIMDAKSYDNNSSDGIYYKNGDETIILAGNNSATGYVVRWDNIVPSDAGSFKVRAQATADSDNGNAYPILVFMLVGNIRIGSLPRALNQRSSTPGGDRTGSITVH